MSDLYEIIDERFRTGKCHVGDSKLETLYEGCRWAEGPLYVPAGRYLLWSDIPNDRLLRWDETTGAVGVFRSPAGHPNGNTLVFDVREDGTLSPGPVFTESHAPAPGAGFDNTRFDAAGRLWVGALAG